MIRNDELKSTGSVTGAVVALTVDVVCTCAASGLEGTDVGVFDGTFDGGIDVIWEEEDDGEEEGKDDGDMEADIDGIDDTPVGELDGVAVVGGNVSAPYPLNKKPVNNKPFTYC